MMIHLYQIFTSLPNFVSKIRVSLTFLPVLALNCHPLDFCLPWSCNCSHEPLCLDPASMNKIHWSVLIFAVDLHELLIYLENESVWYVWFKTISLISEAAFSFCWLFHLCYKNLLIWHNHTSLFWLFLPVLLVLYMKNQWQNQYHGTSLVYRIFMASCLILKYFNPFWVDFHTCYKDRISFFYIWIPNTIIKEIILSPLCIFAMFVNECMCIYFSVLNSVSSIYSLSVFMPISVYMTSFVEIRSVMPPTLFFLLKIALDIWSRFYF
jgi:hypothetical protein